MKEGAEEAEDASATAEASAFLEDWRRVASASGRIAIARWPLASLRQDWFERAIEDEALLLKQLVEPAAGP